MPNTRRMIAGLLVVCACAIGPSQLSWGVRTIELPVPTDPTISFRIWFKVGSQNDPVGKEGLASLTAAMISDAGTVRNSYDQTLKKLYPMAASYGAEVDKEMTVITGRVHRDYVNAFTALLTEAILHPAFTAEDFQRHKTNVTNYLDKTLRYSNDEAFGKEMLYDAIFANTPYGHPDEGLPASVKFITLYNVKNFYHTHYTAGNVVIGLGGNFDPSLASNLTAALGALPPGAPAAVAKPSPKPPHGIEAVLVEKETKSTA